MNKFRLILLINICSITGFGLDAHQRLNNMMYPVKGKLPYEILMQHNVSEDDFETVLRDVLGRVGSEFTFNRSDTHLCESQQHRRDLVYDILIKGQDIFRLRKDGIPERKQWNTYDWKFIANED